MSREEQLERHLATMVPLLREILQWTKLKHTPWAQKTAAALEAYDKERRPDPSIWGRPVWYL